MVKIESTKYKENNWLYFKLRGSKGITVSQDRYY